MNEKINLLYDILLGHLKDLIKNRTTPEEVKSIPEIARVLTELISYKTQL